MATNSRQQSAQRVASIGIGTNVVLTIFKAALGVLSGSNAVIADAFHSASDIAASAIVFVGVRLSGAPPDETHHYGHAKLESVAGKIVSLFLLVTGLGLGYNAWGVLREGAITVPTALALWATGISIVVKEGLYRYVKGMGDRLNSTALVAEAWHHRSDAVSSVAALVGVIGARIGYPALDAWAGLAVAALILHMGAKLYIQSVRELIDEAPNEALVEQIKDVTLNTPGVLSVNEVKARQHGPVVLVDIKLCVNRHLTVERGHEIAAEAKDKILGSVAKIGDVLIHVNPCHHSSTLHDVPDCELCGEGPHSGHSEEAIVNAHDNNISGDRDPSG